MSTATMPPSDVTTIPKDTKIEQKQQHVNPLEHKDAESNLNTKPTTTERISQSLTDFGNSMSQTASNLDSRMGISTTAHSVGQQASDVAAHMSSAISHGNVGHAFSHAPTAAKIGQAEVKKHNQGPMEEQELLHKNNPTKPVEPSATNL